MKIKKRLIYVLLVCTLLCLVGCSDSDSESKSTPDYTMMNITIYPGGSMTQEQYKENTVHYTINSDGSVINDKKSIELSEADLHTVKEYYNKFTKNSVHEIKTQIMDGNTKSIIVYDSTLKEIGKFESNSNSQCEEVDKIVDLINKYYY